MDTLDGVFAGFGLVSIIGIAYLVLMAMVLLFFLPFYVRGIYNQTRKVALEAEKGRMEMEILNKKLSSLYNAMQKWPPD